MAATADGLLRVAALPALRDHVVVIRLCIAHEQMGWVAAGRVVAAVADEGAIGDRAVGQAPGDPMSPEPELLRRTKDAIAERVVSASPQPARR